MERHAQLANSQKHIDRPGRPWRPSLWLVIAMPLTFACGDGEAIDEPSTLTYYQDVKPIIDAKCASCHFEGGVAPMALMTYEQTSTFAGAIQFAVEGGVMPPWHPSDDCDELFAVRALEPAQKTAILDWVAAGALEGDPANEAAPIDVESSELSRVDATLVMPESYVPTTAPNETDDYRCFILPWPETTTKYVTGLRVEPGNLATAHHAIAFLVPPEQVALYMDLDASEEGPGWTCFGGPGGPPADWLGGWVPGNSGDDFPEGVGIEIQPGSIVVLQMHYNVSNTAGEPVGPDRTALEVRLEDIVDKPARVMPWANPGWVMGTEDMLIPANDPDVMHSFALDPTIFPFSGADRVDIYSVGLHMHRLGTRASLAIERADGASTCLLQIDEWDFDWQGNYFLRAPQTLDRGDQLRVECHWDNSAENQPLVNGQQQLPQDVNWGEGTRDEMCLGILLVTAE